jgi:hypothetical protein
MTSVVRLGALALGLVCSCLGMYGAVEFAMKLEGGAVTYLVLAAPVIAGAAASIPVLAEATWRDRAYFKALLWWAALVPAGAVVLFSAAERVHVAKAGVQAERLALRSQASRAQAALTKADAELVSARDAANQARGLKKCGTDCRPRLAAGGDGASCRAPRQRGASSSGEAGHDGQPSSGSRVATPDCTRRGGIPRHLDWALNCPIQARSADHQSAAETAEAQIAVTEGSRCERTGLVRAERQLQRRSLRPTLKAKPKGAP